MTPPAVRMLRAQQQLGIAAQEARCAATQAVRTGDRGVLTLANGRVRDALSELLIATTAVMIERSNA